MWNKLTYKCIISEVKISCIILTFSQKFTSHLFINLWLGPDMKFLCSVYCSSFVCLCGLCIGCLTQRTHFLPTGKKFFCWWFLQNKVKVTLILHGSTLVFNYNRNLIEQTLRKEYLSASNRPKLSRYFRSQ